MSFFPGGTTNESSASATNSSSTVDDRPCMNESDSSVMPTISEKPPAKVVEVTANIDCLGWETPPYCELCHVHFSGEQPSRLHFDGQNHRNRLETWKKYHNRENPSDSTSKNVPCRLCWKELNTQAMLDIHCRSPVHIQEEQKRAVVLKLKEDYRQLRGE